MEPAKAVDEYITKQPKHQLELLSAVRKIIHDIIPFAVESLKYNTPFYTHKGLLCYLNPTKEGMYLGLCKGYLHSDPAGILTGKDLKEIRYIVMNKKSDIKKKLLKEYLEEAVVLNEVKRSSKNALWNT